MGTIDYTHDIVESNILEIPLDRYTKTFNFFTQVYKEGNFTYLVRLNRKANQLQFYHLNDRVLAFKIKYGGKLRASKLIFTSLKNFFNRGRTKTECW